MLEAERKVAVIQKKWEASGNGIKVGVGGSRKVTWDSDNN